MGNLLGVQHTLLTLDGNTNGCTQTQKHKRTTIASSKDVYNPGATGSGLKFWSSGTQRRQYFGRIYFRLWPLVDDGEDGERWMQFCRPVSVDPIIVHLR